MLNQVITVLKISNYISVMKQERQYMRNMIFIYLLQYGIRQVVKKKEKNAITKLNQKNLIY